MAPKESDIKDTDIAVIGISLRYPESDNIDDFWTNISQQKKMTDVIPSDRWDYKAYYDEDITNEETSNSIYGGFLKDIDKFDARFFHISPAEAELMDPQQRILLQEAWKAVEDAGYSESEIAGKRCGVYMGVTHGDYEKVVEKSGLKNSKYAFTGLNPFMFTGRIAYQMNITGPNMCIDTACSSSLVAISTACQSIVDGECELALAGGIRLMLTPDLQIQTSNIGILASDGKVRSFDKNADGLVLSEGVGVLVLKPLKQAMKDRNQIYGVIKGWGVNQDGKSNGITSPNTQAEINLLQSVYRKFDINPENISYVEANGTASELSDAMEINALTEVYRQYTKKKQFCYIGCCKANMGNATMASGVGGIIKVLQSMKHEVIPALNNFEEENTHIHLEDTPFIANKENVDWKQKEVPRMATVSCFGLSGTNAHIVLQEAPAIPKHKSNSNEKYLILLSGKTKDALAQRICDLIQWLKVENLDATINDIAFTLLKGRSHYKYRLAVIAGSKSELEEALESAVMRKEAENIIYQSEQMSIAKKGITEYEDKMNALEELNVWDLKALKEAAVCYVNGCSIEGKMSEINKDAVIVHMPSYPFEKNRYWVNDVKTWNDNMVTKKVSPLIQENVSTLMEQKYLSRFTGHEYYMEEHRIYGQKVLPGMFYLEMALEAVSAAAGERVTGLSDIMWYAPVVAGSQAKEVITGIIPSDSQIDIEIYNMDAGEKNLNFIATIDMEKEIEIQDKIQTEDLISRCKETIPGAEYYKRFQSEELFIGEKFHSIQALYRNEDEAVSEIKLSDSITDTQEDYKIHPVLLNSAVETLISLINEENKVYMPLAVKDFLILSESQNTRYAYIQRKSEVNQMHKFDMYLLDAQGNIVVYINEIVIKETPKEF